ncbi:MAG: phosphoribosylformylglycinamidine cyclo-ligase [Candidatus Omnitrophica bacterium]|nr:phosphoribosylformylglycinamidine cyclo-ligase [Candidatus Omnitrophota bacterium]MBU4458199.1 phosphoribosylformylglycinamidine cyclo-ligase [Candidatus Omnitrophota bacterium]
MNYKKAGVNIDKANRFVKEIAKHASKTKRTEIMGGIGGFGAFAGIPKGYKNPVLVSSTDGVGTKLLIADILNKHNTIGIDLVAMCANDIVVTGAAPLFFLDYFATGKLNNKKALDIVKGICGGCKKAGCALIGGETAELPGMYKGEQYDLAGFCVGVVEKNKIIDGKSVKPGDRIIGIQSNGLHSNGFSLARKVFRKSELKGSIGNALLKPTIIYVKPILDLIKKINVKSLAHITGGGFYDNIPRVLPKTTDALIYQELWRVPEIFKIIQKRANIDDKEMYRTFNMGIGMVAVVSKKDIKKTHGIIKRFGLRSWTIGEIIKGKGRVII